MLSVEDQVHEKVTSLTLDPQVALAAEAPPSMTGTTSQMETLSSWYVV
jgi:hypothetical protein